MKEDFPGDNDNDSDSVHSGSLSGQDGQLDALSPLTLQGAHGVLGQTLGTLPSLTDSHQHEHQHHHTQLQALPQHLHGQYSTGADTATTPSSTATATALNFGGPKTVFSMAALAAAAAASSTKKKKAKAKEVNGSKEKDKDNKDKDKDKIPRPPNAFILYRSDNQPRLVASFVGQGKSSRDFSALIGQMWKDELPHVKDHYQSLAAERMKEHRSRFPEYKYRPSQAKLQKLERERLEREVNEGSSGSNNSYGSNYALGDDHGHVPLAYTPDTNTNTLAQTTATTASSSTANSFKRPRDVTEEDTDTPSDGLPSKKRPYIRKKQPLPKHTSATITTSDPLNTAHILMALGQDKSNTPPTTTHSLSSSPSISPSLEYDQITHEYQDSRNTSKPDSPQSSSIIHHQTQNRDHNNHSHNISSATSTNFAISTSAATAAATAAATVTAPAMKSLLEFQEQLAFLSEKLAQLVRDNEVCAKTFGIPALNAVVEAVQLVVGMGSGTSGTGGSNASGNEGAGDEGSTLVHPGMVAAAATTGDQTILL